MSQRESRRHVTPVLSGPQDCLSASEYTAPKLINARGAASLLELAMRELLAEVDTSGGDARELVPLVAVATALRVRVWAIGGTATW